MLRVAAVLLCVSLAVFGGPLSVEASSKKGVAVNQDNKDHSAAVSQVKAHWYYDWGSSGNAGANFVPMIWGAADVSKLGSLPSSSFVLAFNEPNLQGQANMSPKQAAALWPKFQATGRKLVGPAVADCPPTNTGACIYGTLNWYRDFLSACKGCRIDAVAMHIYNCDAQDMKNKITLLYNVVKRPIWLTEFACAGAASQTDAVNKLMKPLLPWLESSNMVGRYSWFMLTGDSGDLAQNSLTNGKTLTATGKFYAGVATEAVEWVEAMSAFHANHTGLQMDESHVPALDSLGFEKKQQVAFE